MPVGIVDPGGTGATVAVNVTACPGLDGLGAAVSDVAEG